MIVTFGSSNVDLIYRVKDAPEAGQTVAAQSFSLEAGGKGANQALAAARDGASVTFVGAVGEDPLSDMALREARAAGVDLQRVWRSDKPTGTAAILVAANGENRITISAGANEDACQADIPDADMRAASSVLLQLETPLPQVEALITRCAAAGVRSILNLAPARNVSPDVLATVGLLVVNEDEAESLAAMMECGSSAKELALRLGTDVLRTLGGRGAEAFAGGEQIDVAAHETTVVDTTSAGDCFIGVLAAALDRGASLRAAMERASVAAALCCARAGSQASVPFAADTDRAMAR